MSPAKKKFIRDIVYVDIKWQERGWVHEDGTEKFDEGMGYMRYTVRCEGRKSDEVWSLMEAHMNKRPPEGFGRRGKGQQFANWGYLLKLLQSAISDVAQLPVVGVDRDKISWYLGAVPTLGS